MNRLFFFFILFLFTLQSIQAQKVVLVLSGGGAKGLAHLGVIKALEENDIPIDCIIGTSMGGVIGGFYAAGYSIEEMEKIATSSEFQNWVAGRLDDQYRYFLFKEDSNASLLTFRVGLDSLFNISLRSALVNDHALNFALAELLMKATAKAKGNFDSLFVPFRSLAADIFTQEEVILRSGNLNDAIRATLNVPFFFKPIKVNDKYLFDGGVYDNFPVNNAQEEFSPDYIIGINVSSKTYTEYPYQEDEELIANPLFYLMLSKSDSSQIDEKGIYIQPALEGYSALDFSEVKTYIRLGYEAGLRKIAEIKSKIPKSAPRTEVIAKRNMFKSQLPEIRLDSIRITGLKKNPTTYLRRMFRYKPKNLNLENVKKKYFRLVEADKFEVLYPSFLYDHQSKTFDVSIKAKPDKSLKAFMGGNLASRSISQLFVGFETDWMRNLLYTLKGNFYFGQFYLSSEWKARLDVPTRTPFFIEPHFIFNRWNYEAVTENLYKTTRPRMVQNQNDTQIGLNFAFAGGRKGKFNWNFSYFINNDRYTNSKQISLSDTLDLTRFKGYVSSFSFSQNSLNRKQYASYGMALKTQLQYINGTETFFPGNTSTIMIGRSISHHWFRLKTSFEKYVDFGKYVWGYSAESVFSTQNLFQNYTATLLIAPAFYPLQDSQSLFLPKFRSFNYLAFGLKHIYKIKSRLELRLEGYGLGAFRPILKQGQQSEFSEDFLRMSLAGTLGLVYHSILAPISLSINYYDDDIYKWSAFLHIGFLLYNRRSLD